MKNFAQIQLNKQPFVFVGGILLIIMLSLIGCGSNATSEAENGADLEPVTFQMGWVHEYSAVGGYAAEENGRFAEQNLDVTINEGGFDEQGYIDPLVQVINGEADFGVTSAVALLQSRAEGNPVVAIAAEIQRSPFALISLSDSNILRPSDLPGKTVAVTEDSSLALYNTLLSSQGINADDVELVPRTTFGIEPLLEGEVDALGGWIVNEGILVKEAGLEPTFILLSDYGINNYTSLVFTTEEMINNNPDVVERFLRAYLQGLQDVADDPNQAIEYILAYNDSLVAEEQDRRLQAWLPLMKPAGSTVGSMQAETWQQIHDYLLEEAVLSEAADLEAAYDMSFLENIYNK